MKIFAVRIGDKYGIEYENYLKYKLSEYDLKFIREPFDPRVQLQWNKMSVMNMNIDEPIVIIDIDVLLVNNYKKLFDYPIERGEFLSIPGWWRDTSKSEYKLNGGFFKYYPTDCKYIYEKFMKNPIYWQSYYIKNGTTNGPVNGEQHFVEDSVKEKLKLKLIPDSWVTRWCADDTILNDKDYSTWQKEITEKYKNITNNDYIYLGGEFHNDIKLVHFTHSLNKPHKWKDYQYFKNV
jgi:hypothetical protein